MSTLPLIRCMALIHLIALSKTQFLHLQNVGKSSVTIQRNIIMTQFVNFHKEHRTIQYSLAIIAFCNTFFSCCSERKTTKNLSYLEIAF